MATDVDICNLALSHIGDGGNVSALDGTDASMQASHCIRFYPIARDQALEVHAWSFATKRDGLTPAGTNPTENWAYAYNVPDDCLRILALLDADTDDFGRTAAEATDPYPYVTEMAGSQKILLCDVASASIRYVFKQTDPSRYSPLFVNAVSLLLASYLAGPVLKGKSVAGVAQGMLQRYMLALAEAQGADAQGNVRSNVHSARVPNGIRARA